MGRRIGFGPSRGRILRKMSNYQNSPPAVVATGLPWSSTLPLEPGEVMLGWYDNNLGQLEQRVVVTSQGLHVYQAGTWHSARTWPPCDAQ